jgi:hypothetical protein
VQAVELCVGKGQLAEIGIFRVLPHERRWRVVWKMRIIEMNPGEKWFLGRFSEPRDGIVDDNVRPPLDLREG